MKIHALKLQLSALEPMFLLVNSARAGPIVPWLNLLWDLDGFAGPKNFVIREKGACCSM